MPTISTIIKTKISLIDKTLLLAVLPLVGYIIAFYFEAGYLNAFEFSSDYVEVEIELVIKSLVSLIQFLIVCFFVFNFFSYFLNLISLKNEVQRRIFRALLLTLIFTVPLFILNPNKIDMILVSLLILIFSFFYQLGFAHFFSNGKDLNEKIINEDKHESENPIMSLENYIYKNEYLSTYWFLIILTLMFTMLSSARGLQEARDQHNSLLFIQDNKSYLVIRSNKNHILAINEKDRSEKLVIRGDYNLTFTRVETKPIQPKEINPIFNKIKQKALNL